MKILVVEDEPGIASFIEEGLEEEGFRVDVAYNGPDGLEKALDKKENYDILLLDWMLPGISGLDICKKVRKENSLVPVIFLTARDTVQDTVFALEAGANDYIKKPFALDELLARIRVQLRPKDLPSNQLSHRYILMDLDKHQVFLDDKEVVLTPKEFSLLEFLLRNKGKVCKRMSIIENVWDIHFDYDTSVIDVYINVLRKKINKPNEPGLIRTIRGVGYIISDV